MQAHPVTQGAAQNLSARIQQEGERPELRGNNQIYIGHLLRMLSVMEDILQVGVRLMLRKIEAHQFPPQSLVSSKSNKAEDYKAFRDEVVNTLKAYPELVGDERLGPAIARVSRVGNP